jgi:transposase, IS5 family
LSESSRLDAIIDMDHQLVALARKVDWGFLEERFGEAYRDGPSQPPLPTRLMAGLIFLKYTYDLIRRGSVRALGGEPLLSVLLRGGVYPARVGPGPQLTRWRQRIGEEKMNVLLQEIRPAAALPLCVALEKPLDFGFGSCNPN